MSNTVNGSGVLDSLYCISVEGIKCWNPLGGSVSLTALFVEQKNGDILIKYLLSGFPVFLFVLLSLHLPLRLPFDLVPPFWFHTSKNVQVFFLFS